MAEQEGPATDLALGQPPNVSGPSQSATKQELDISASAAHAITSLADNGLSKRPRDARLLHMILANLGVTAYQERVPLQLMDFAYRYTSSILQDALHLTSEGYGGSGHIQGTTKGAGAGGNNDMTSITLSSLRLSIASRTHYQFSPTLPKEFYHEIAQERNRVALPSMGREWGLRLPPEQYCLTGVGWGLKDEWESEEEERKPEGEGEDRSLLDQMLDEGVEGMEEDDEKEAMDNIFVQEFNLSEKDTAMDQD